MRRLDFSYFETKILILILFSKHPARHTYEKVKRYHLCTGKAQVHQALLAIIVDKKLG
jgi:hypothetical protein